MNIIQLIQILMAKKKELDRNPNLDENKEELARINAALELLKTEDGRKQQNQFFEQFDVEEKLKVSYTNWNDLSDDCSKNPETVEQRCYFITNDGKIEPVHIDADPNKKPDIVNALDARMMDGTLFFQRSLDGTSWHVYQKQTVTKKVPMMVNGYGDRVVYGPNGKHIVYGIIEVDVEMQVPVRIDNEIKLNRILREYNLDPHELDPYKTGENYVWNKKVDGYSNPYNEVHRMLHLMNNLSGQYILDNKDTAACLKKYIDNPDNQPVHISNLEDGLGGYNEEELETLLICSGMSPEAISYLEAHQDPNTEYKKELPMTEVQREITLNYIYGVNMLQDIYTQGNNRESHRVGAILAGREALIGILNMNDDDMRTEKLGKLIRKTLEMYAMQIQGCKCTGVACYAAPLIMQKILKLLDNNEALRRVTGLTDEERSCYDAAARVAQYHQDYMKLLAEAKKNGHVEVTPEFVGRMLTYQLINQMENQSQIAHENTRQHSYAKMDDNKGVLTQNVDDTIKGVATSVSLPLLQLARTEGGLEKLVAEMQKYVEKLPVYQRYIGMSEKEFIDNLKLDDEGTKFVMDEFVNYIGDYKHRSSNGIADWYIDTSMGWRRIGQDFERNVKMQNTLTNKIREQQQKSSEDPYSLEAPKDIMRLLRRNIDAAWKVAHGASLKWKMLGEYKRMHSKLNDIREYLAEHNNRQTDIKKLEVMLKELSEASQDYIARKQGKHTRAEIEYQLPGELNENGKKRYDAALDVLTVAQDGINKLHKITRYTDLFCRLTGESFENFDPEKMTQVASTIYVNGSNYMLMKGWTELDELKLSEMCQDMQTYMDEFKKYTLLRCKPNDPMAVFTPVITERMSPRDIARMEEYAESYTAMRNENLKAAIKLLGDGGMSRDGIETLLDADDKSHQDEFWKTSNNKKYSNLDYHREITGLIYSILLERGFQLKEIENPTVRVEEKNRLIEQLRQVADGNTRLADNERERMWADLLQEACDGIKKLKTKPIDMNDMGFPTDLEANQLLIQNTNDIIQIIEKNQTKSAWCRQMHKEGSFMDSLNQKKIQLRDNLFARLRTPHTDAEADYLTTFPEQLAVQNYIDKKGLKWNEEWEWMLDENIPGNEYEAKYRDIKDVQLEQNNGSLLFIKYYNKYKQASDPESKNKWNEKILDYVDKVDKKQRLYKAITKLREYGDGLDLIADHLNAIQSQYDILNRMLDPDPSGNIRLIDETIRRNGDNANKSKKAVDMAFKSIAEHCTAIHAFINEKITDMDPDNEQTLEQLNSLRKIRDELGKMQIRPSKYTTLLEAVDIVRTLPADSLHDREHLRKVCDALNKYAPGLLENKKNRDSLSEAEQLDLISLFAIKEFRVFQGGQMSDPKLQEKVFNESVKVLKVTKEYDGSGYIYGTFSSELGKVLDEDTAKLIANYAEMRKQLKDPNLRKCLKFNNLNNQKWKDLKTQIKSAAVGRIATEKNNIENKNRINMENEADIEVQNRKIQQQVPIK